MGALPDFLAASFLVEALPAQAQDFGSRFQSSGFGALEVAGTESPQVGPGGS